MLPPGALYHRIPGTCQISVGISPRHPAADNSCYSGTQHLWQIDYSRVPTTYLHPLLGPAHRLQVTRYRRRVDEIVRQKFDPTTTTRGSLGHQRRTDRLRILNLWRRTTTSRFDSGSTSPRSSSAIARAPPWLPPPARGLLRRLPRSLAPRLQRVQPGGWFFPWLRPLSTKDMRISLPRRPRLLLEEDCVLRSVLTFYNAGLPQCSLHGWRHGLSLGEGSGLLGGWRGTFFSHCRAGFILLPRQVRGFPAQYTIGCQPSTTTKLHVLLGKDLHLQA
jgi:hypothetical protein